MESFQSFAQFNTSQIINITKLPSCSHSRSNEEPGVEETQVCCFIKFRTSSICSGVSKPELIDFTLLKKKCVCLLFYIISFKLFKGGYIYLVEGSFLEFNLAYLLEPLCHPPSSNNSKVTGTPCFFYKIYKIENVKELLIIYILLSNSYIFVSFLQSRIHIA